MSLLEIHDLDVRYKRRDGTSLLAVSAANVDVSAGEIVGLVGETGCGKSSLAKAACGLVPAARGRVLFEGQPLEPLRRRARRANEVGLQMVFQSPYGSLNPRRRIGDQIADGLRPLHRANSEDRYRVVAEMLERVGLPRRMATRLPHELSGGQRQRVAIARALAPRPTMLVLDEPLAALDASVQAQVANLLAALARDLNVGMLLISHDLAVVHHIAQRIVVMYLGTVVEAGPTEHLWHEPLHPYTKALIGAIPSASAIGEVPNAPTGEVPDPAHPPSGCRFHPRCPYVMDVCRTQVPLTFQPRPDRTVACWLSRPESSPPRPDRPEIRKGAPGDHLR